MAVKQPAAELDFFRPLAIGEESIISDFHELIWQNML